jgi:hypothetical protein
MFFCVMKRDSTIVIMRLVFFIFASSDAWSSWKGTEEFYFSHLNSDRWSSSLNQLGEGSLIASGGKLVFKPGVLGQTHTTVLPWKESLPTNQGWNLEVILAAPGTEVDTDSVSTGVIVGVNGVPQLQGDGIAIRLDNVKLADSVARHLVFETRFEGQVFSHYDQVMNVNDIYVRIKLEYLQSANMFIFCFEDSSGSWVCVAGVQSKFTVTNTDVFQTGLEASTQLSAELSEEIWLDDFYIYTDEHDKDSDGITKADEDQKGTSPTSADSDYDGLTDPEEIDTYGTDPLKADSDGDQIPDGLEVIAGGNPLDEAALPSLLDPVSNPTGTFRSLTIQTFSNLTYQVQQSTDLKVWVNHGDAISGSGELQSMTLGENLDANAFYRIQVSD